jgi:hypothetical protein
MENEMSLTDTAPHRRRNISSGGAYESVPDVIEWDDGTQSTPAGAFASAIRSAAAKMKGTTDV